MIEIGLIIGYLDGALVFMQGGCKRLLRLLGKPDKKHPLNPRTYRKTFAIVLGGFGGFALWNAITFYAWLIWRAHIISKTGAG